MDIDLNLLKKEESDKAKLWWKSANILNILIILAGFISNVLPNCSFILTCISTVFILLYYFFQLFSDTAKDRAEWLHRQFEMQDSLGWKIDIKNVMEVLMLSKKTKDNTDNQTNYFDSKRPKSTKRLVENFAQSAVYSKIQSGFMAKIIFAISLVLMLLSVAGLLYFFQTENTSKNLISFAFLTVIQFLVATGYIRLALDYFKFSNSADKIAERAFSMLKTKSPNKEEAIKLAHDYQIERAAAPLIPEWVWKHFKNKLNEHWNNCILDIN